MTTTIASIGAIASWADWMISVSWQLVPLTIIVAAGDWLLRRTGPVVRSALWWIVLVKLVLPPGLLSPLAPLAPISIDVPATLRAASGASTAPVALDTASAASWQALAFAIWMTGVLAAAAVARGRYRRIRARCLSESAAAPRAVRRRAVLAARRLGLRRLPEIRLAADSNRREVCCSGPAVVGFLRPVVIVPRTLVDRGVQLDHVLLHELAHVRRRDPLTTLIALGLQMLFWFHPSVWLARRRLATLREMACDRTIARVLRDETDGYRRTLILLAQSARAAATTASSSRTSQRAWPARAPGTLGLFERQAQLVTRLEALGRPVRVRCGVERAAGLLAAVAVLVSCAPLASPRARAVPDTTTTAPEAASPIDPAIELPPIDQLPGSLQKRYAVMRAMALEEHARHQRN